MLLCVLIHWVVFVVIFRDDFSKFLQSFIVFVMRKGVTIRNPKTDSNSEFGCPNTAEERERCARGTSKAIGQACCPRVSHVCHTWRTPLCPRVPHVEGDVSLFDWSLNSISSPSLFPPYIFEIPCRILYNL